MKLIRKGQGRWVSGKENSKQLSEFAHAIFGIATPNFNDQLDCSFCTTTKKNYNTFK